MGRLLSPEAFVLEMPSDNLLNKTPWEHVQCKAAETTTAQPTPLPLHPCNLGESRGQKNSGLEADLTPQGGWHMVETRTQMFGQLRR